MKPIGRAKKRFEVFFLRMCDIKKRDCTSFILPKAFSRKPGDTCTLVSSLREGTDRQFNVRINDVRYKPIRRLTINEIESLHMDDDYEIAHPMSVNDHCWIRDDAIDLLPENHPLKWLNESFSLCEDCAEKIVDVIRESCTQAKELCNEYNYYGTCDRCTITQYLVGNSSGGIESDSVGTCQYEWDDENGEHHCCHNLIEFCATNHCAETEFDHFMERGYADGDFDRHSLKTIAEHLDGVYSSRCKERTFLKKMLLHAIWNTHWKDSYPYEKNPVVGLHTFEIV